MNLFYCDACMPYQNCRVEICADELPEKCMSDESPEWHKVLTFIGQCNFCGKYILEPEDFFSSGEFHEVFCRQCWEVWKNIVEQIKGEL